jgi:hypothetical protein
MKTARYAFEDFGGLHAELGAQFGQVVRVKSRLDTFTQNLEIMGD